MKEKIMINLGNLKAGQTKVIGDVTIVKGDGYEITTNEGQGTLSYNKDEKAWTLVTGGAVFFLEGASSKTAAELAVQQIAKGFVAPVEVEEPEVDFDALLAEVVAEADAETVVEADEADVDEVEIAETITETVSVKGGLGPHRAAVYATLAAALGATFTKHKEKGVGYQGALTVTISGPEGVPAKVVDVARLIIAKAEQEMGPELSRAASRRTRLGGIHHSAGGYYARAGLLRGLAKGVGVLLAGEESDWLEEADLGSGRYEEAAYELGVEAAPAIKDLVTAS